MEKLKAFLKSRKRGEMIKAILLIFLVSTMLFFSPAKGSESEWLGTYVGSEIPGYKILESGILWRIWRGGPTEDLNFESMSLDIQKDCMKHNGKALVNVKYNFSLGDVSFRGKSGWITTVSPGVYGMVFADCVTRVKKKRLFFF